MEPFSTDAELRERSSSEPSLFAGLYERHGPAVRRYVVRQVGSDAAEDSGRSARVVAGRYFAMAVRPVGKDWGDQIHREALASSGMNLTMPR